MNNLRWLLCTHHLLDYSGSEVVILELAEELLSRGHHVCLFAQFQDPNFLAKAAPHGATAISDKADIDISKFDVVYCQHQSASQFMAGQDLQLLLSENRPAFIYNHLSPFEPFEAPGPFFEEAFADIILCNSMETQQSLKAYGSAFSDVTIFPNPSPKRFSAKARLKPSKPKRIIAISNHPPKELVAALVRIEAKGVEVTRVGRRSGQKRLELEDLVGHDAVITIGKSVQYAIRARLPVFCYDHFGGPGWLTEQTFKLAGQNNFSGRCHQKRRTGEELALEILEGFAGSFTFSSVPKEYCLEIMVDHLFRLVEALPENRKPVALEAETLKGLLEREKSVYHLVDREYKSKRSLAIANQESDKKMLDLAAEIVAESAGTEELKVKLEAVEQDRNDLLLKIDEYKVQIAKGRGEAETLRTMLSDLRENHRIVEKQSTVRTARLHWMLKEARLKPLKMLKRKIISRLLYSLSEQEVIFSRKRRERFRRSSQKRDPMRNEVVGGTTYSSEPLQLENSSEAPSVREDVACSCTKSVH